MRLSGEAFLRRLSWTWVRPALAGAAAVGLAIWATRLEPSRQALLWTALMLLAFVGWGALVNLWLAPRRRADWGLRAGWGMAASILCGGFLCVAHVASRGVLIAQVALGVALFFHFDLLRGRRRISAVRVRRRFVVCVDQAGVIALLAVTYAALAFLALAYVGDHSFNPSDDVPLYLSLPEKLVQTGIYLEPFAARRISILGGQVYLHATFFSVASPFYAHSVEGGLCESTLVALLVGHVRRSCPKKWQLAALALVLLLFFSLRTVRRNTGSLFSGVVAMVTLYRTVRTPMGKECDATPWPMEGRRIAALAALAVVPIVLRPSNAAAVMPFVVLVFASDFVMSNRRPWSREAATSLLRVAALFAGVFALALGPWSLMLKQSCGTFFYPLGRDNTTAGFSFFSKSTDLAENTLSLVSYGRPIATLLPFAIAGLVPLRGRARNDLLALTVGAAIGMFALARQAAFFGQDDTSRWYFTFVVAAALMVAASAGRDWGRSTLVALALAAHLAIAKDDVLGFLEERIKLAHEAELKSVADRNAWTALTAEYREVQSHVPAGATIGVATLETFRFDFKRNQIFLLDVLGAMGPAPGWPLHQGPEKLATYLHAHGVGYVVYVDFNAPGELYNRGHWQSHLAKTDSYLVHFAQIQLDAEDAIEAMPRVRRVVYAAHGMTVVDLGAPLP